MGRADPAANVGRAEDDRALSQTKACSLGVLMHTAAGFYLGGFSSDGDRDVAPLSITSL